MTLTDKQLRKIFAAQEAGLTKRELFEADVSGKRVNSLTKKDQDRLVEDLIAKRPVPKKFLINQKSMTASKAMAVIDLQQDKEAKEAFLQQDSLRLQSFRAKELR